MQNAGGETHISESDWRRGISLPAEFGGQAIPPRIISDVTRLRLLLFQFCNRSYSKDVLGFAFAVRVDGELKRYHFEGTDRVKRNKKQQYIQADIGIPLERWRGLSQNDFRRSLCVLVKGALEACVGRLKKDGVRVDEDQLRGDFARVQARFIDELPPALQ
jgi:hypothetical protein